MAKPRTHRAHATLAENRRARFDYDIVEAVEAGIELLGHEVKSVKAGRMGLNGSYAVMQAGQLYLLNAQVPPYQPKNVPETYDPTRSRRLLLHRSQLAAIAGKLKQKTYVLVPLKAYLKGALIKIELGLGRSRKAPDKREYIKKREAEREMRGRV